MADLPLDDDLDAAAMAEAMGFTGFGMQRPTKRKFNANADAAVDGPDSPAGGRKKGVGNVSKTGANSAPLGARRNIYLPAAPSSLPARPSAATAFEPRDPAQIDLGQEESETSGTGRSGNQVGVNGLEASLGLSGANVLSDTEIKATQQSTADPGPPVLPASPPYHPRGQIQQRSSGGRGRGGGGGHDRDHGPRGEPGATWWVGYYDPNTNENPWHKLEKQKGLQPRGAWVSNKGGHGRAISGTSEARGEYSSQNPQVGEAVGYNTGGTTGQIDAKVFSL